MGFFDFFKRKETINESIPAFKDKGEVYTEKQLQDTKGEGIDYYSPYGTGQIGYYSFNSFIQNYIDIIFENELQKLQEYKRIADFPEVGEVLDDAVIESTQLDENGNLFTLEILDPDLIKNENALKNINNAFDKLFNKKLNIKENMQDLMYNFLVDGRIYIENVIDVSNKTSGIQKIKRLPSETMDFIYDPETGEIKAFLQYLSSSGSKARTLEQAKNDKNMIVFEPSQITFVNSGRFGKTKKEIFGILEKVKQPYNQLKLLETSVIIYRLVRAPERYVFKIDCGNMPPDKAEKHVEKMKRKLTTKMSYDPINGTMQGQPDIISVLDNFFIPQSSNRGSDISTIGGSSTAGFTELSDIKYFATKLYRALKYPISRINNSFQNQDSMNTFNFGGTMDIPRDEIKWACFLQQQQNRFCTAFLDLFLIHLDFKGYMKEYKLSSDKLKISMTAPNNFQEHLKQKLLEVKMQNFSQLYSYQEFSKYFLITNMLGWTEDMWNRNIEGFNKDLELAPKIQKVQSTMGGFGGGFGGMQGDENMNSDDENEEDINGNEENSQKDINNNDNMEW